MELKGSIRELDVRRITPKQGDQWDAFDAYELRVEVSEPFDVISVRVPRELSTQEGLQKLRDAQGQMVLLAVETRVNRGYLNWNLRALPEVRQKNQTAPKAATA